MEPTLFSIGKAADICSVTTRTLRYYEQNGLIRPDRVDQENRYRYYSYETLLRVQTIRYLLDEGFSLAEIKSMLQKEDLETMRSHFSIRISEAEEELRYMKQRLDSLKAWHTLFVEGDHVLKHTDLSVRTRFFPEHNCFFLKHHPTCAEEQTMAYLESAYYTAYKKHGNDLADLGGSINVHYSSCEDRINGDVKELTLLQSVYPDSPDYDNTMSFGGFLAASCYHIGAGESVSATYYKIIDWCHAHGLKLRGDSLERHVLDGYSIVKEDHYVTEILLPITDNL